MSRILIISILSLAVLLAACGEVGAKESSNSARANLTLGNDVGQLAVPFTLPSAQGPSYSLSSFQGNKNLVVVFYRAFW